MSAAGATAARSDAERVRTGRRPTIRPRGILILIFATAALIGLSSTMLGVALPHVVDDLQAPAWLGNWMVLSYLVVNGSMLVLCGQLAESGDPRKVFLAGMVTFAGSSLALSLVADPVSFVLIRAAQGAGGAMLLATAAAILVVIFPGARLRGAMGVYLAGFAVAQVAGPGIGGVVASAWSWRWLFVLSTVVSGTAAVAALLLLRALPRRTADGARGVDVWGNLLILMILSGLMFGLSRVQDLGWTSPVVLVSFGLALAAMPWFVLVEWRAASPAIHLGLLRSAPFSLANASGMLLAIPRIVPIVLLGLYFQAVRGDTAPMAALKVTPLAAAVALGSMLAGPVGRRIEGRVLAAWCAVAAMAGVGGLIAVLATAADDLLLMVALGVVGVATGLFSTVNATDILRQVPGRAASVNGIRTMFQMAGISLGTAVMLSLAASGLPVGQADAFLAADSAALSELSLLRLTTNYTLALGVMAALCALAVIASLLLVAVRRPPEAERSTVRRPLVSSPTSDYSL